MSRVAIFAYGVISYLVFFATFLYSIGFIGNFVVPKTVDAPATDTTTGVAIAINMVLLGIFGLQHSIMARPAWKREWTKWIPEPAERSTYVLASVAVMVLMFVFWQPIGGTVWHVETPALRNALTALYLAGFGVVLLSTILLNHFDLFGLRQVTLHLQGKDYEPLPFETPAFYKWVRHPIYVGWIMTFWAAPTMSVGHLLFASVCTAYIFVALIFEERDLVDHFGETYETYQAEVPRLFPYKTRRSADDQNEVAKVTVS